MLLDRIVLHFHLLKFDKILLESRKRNPTPLASEEVPEGVATADTLISQ